MIISGLDIVALVPVSSSDVPDFANTIWITKIKEDGKYGETPAEVPLSKGAKVQAGKLFSFEFSTVDLDNQATISTAITAAQQYWVFAYGLSNVCWRESVTPTIMLNRDNKSGDLQSFTLKFTVHRGTNADIKAGGNLLRNEVADGTYAGANFTTPDTLAVNQAANGSFTAASGKVFKLTPANAPSDAYASLAGNVNKFPCKVGQKFRFNGYGYSPIEEQGVDIIVYSSADVLQETLNLILNNNSLSEDTVTVTDSDAAYFIFRLSMSAPGGANPSEFNRLMLGYGGASRAYSET